MLSQESFVKRSLAQLLRSAQVDGTVAGQKRHVMFSMCPALQGVLSTLTVLEVVSFKRNFRIRLATVHCDTLNISTNLLSEKRSAMRGFGAGFQSMFCQGGQVYDEDV